MIDLIGVVGLCVVYQILEAYKFCHNILFPDDVNTAGAKYQANKSR
jgi:hypothetical protein